MTSTPRLVLASTLAWLSMATVGQAQATETCPPPPSATGTSGSPGPSPDVLHPPLAQIVACIASQSITGSVFRHWADIAKRAEGGEATETTHRIQTATVHVTPVPRGKARAIVNEVMGFLISSYWVIGEAQDLNIVVSAEEVRRRFDHIRHEQFRKRGEFTSFLRSSGQTVADLLFRVRVNILSADVQKRIVAGARGAATQQSALEHFVTEFKSKWQAQTFCLPTFAVRDCGHVQGVL